MKKIFTFVALVAMAMVANAQASYDLNNPIGQDGRRTTALSFAAGIPGGLAMAATIPADVAQFFGMALRLAQELAYLRHIGQRSRACHVVHKLLHFLWRMGV